MIKSLLTRYSGKFILLHRQSLEDSNLINSVDSFLSSAEGMEKLDAICMQLIAIGESIKNLDKVTDCELLKNYPEVDWRGAKGMRDIISHHYFDIDAEAIYLVCKEKIKPLGDTIEKIFNNL